MKFFRLPGPFPIKTVNLWAQSGLILKSLFTTEDTEFCLGKAGELSLRFAGLQRGLTVALCRLTVALFADSRSRFAETHGRALPTHGRALPAHGRALLADGPALTADGRGLATHGRAPSADDRDIGGCI